MKKILLISFLSIISTFAQISGDAKPAARIGIDFFAGVNFERLSDTYNAIYVETGFGLNENLSINLSAGYYITVSKDGFLVKTFKQQVVEDQQWYSAIKYYVNSIEYQVIPLTVSLKFNFLTSDLNPYIIGGVSYNPLDPLPDKNREISVNDYDTFEEIPSEYQKPFVVENGSYGLAFGTGISYNIYKKLYLNLRYLYRFDSEIINTHQVLIGVGI